MNPSHTPHAGAVERPPVCERIHLLMWRRRITQAQLGAAIGVSQSVASKKVRGVVPITVTELQQIAGLLGVEAADLLRDLDAGDPDGLHSAAS